MKKKVKLRYYRENDLQFLHELLSDELTKKYFPLMYTTTIEQSDLRLRVRLEDQKAGYANRLVIQDFWTREPVGEISSRNHKGDKSKMEVAVVIHPKHRGKGYAKAGTLEFIHQIIKEKPEVKTFILEIARDNEQSKSVAKKLEFRLQTNNKPNFDIQFWEKERDEF